MSFTRRDNLCRCSVTVLVCHDLHRRASKRIEFHGNFSTQTFVAS